MKTIIAFYLLKALESVPSPFYNHQFTGLKQSQKKQNEQNYSVKNVNKLDYKKRWKNRNIQKRR